MKTIKPIATLLVLAFLSSTAIASPMTDTDRYNLCKAQVNEQYGNVNKVRLLKMKNFRGNFEAKMRVFTDAGKANYLCSIDKGQTPQLVRIDGDKDSLAAKQ